MRGKLSLEEKYVIKGMYSDDHSIEEIAKQTGRTEKTIKKYLDQELDAIASTIAKAQMGSQEAVEEPISPQFTQEDKTIMSRAREKLLDAGLIEKDADRLVYSAMEVCKKNNIVVKTADHLFGVCVNRMKAGDFITKRTKGGNKGVAIMSGAASARADESRKDVGQRVSRSARGHVFDPTTGEVI